MADIEWARVEDAPVKEKFGGTVRVRTLWRSTSGATAQVVELDPGACWEGIDLHEPPKKFTWFPVSSTMACAIILPAVLYIIRPVRLTCRNPGLAALCLFSTPKVKTANGFYGTG